MDVMVAASVLGLRHAIVTTASLALGHFADRPWRSAGVASFDDGFGRIHGHCGGLSDKVSARRGAPYLLEIPTCDGDDPCSACPLSGGE
jgi:hypothetical protein